MANQGRGAAGAAPLFLLASGAGFMITWGPAMTKTVLDKTAVIPRQEAVASVYIQLRTRSLAKPFDYLVPAAMDGCLKAGSVVLVPFGRQKALGIVAGLKQSSKLPRSPLGRIRGL